VPPRPPPRLRVSLEGGALCKTLTTASARLGRASPQQLLDLLSAREGAALDLGVVHAIDAEELLDPAVRAEDALGAGEEELAEGAVVAVGDERLVGGLAAGQEAALDLEVERARAAVLRAGVDRVAVAPVELDSRPRDEPGIERAPLGGRAEARADALLFRLAALVELVAAVGVALEALLAVVDAREVARHAVLGEALVERRRELDLHATPIGGHVEDLEGRGHETDGALLVRAAEAEARVLRDRVASADRAQVALAEVGGGGERARRRRLRGRDRAGGRGRDAMI